MNLDVPGDNDEDEDDADFVFNDEGLDRTILLLLIFFVNLSLCRHGSVASPAAAPAGWCDWSR